MSSPDLCQATWRKSSTQRGNSGACVELANARCDPRQQEPNGPTLAVDLGEFLTAIKAGKLNH